VREYSKVFWIRKEELYDHARFMKRLDNANEKRKMIEVAEVVFKAKC